MLEEKAGLDRNNEETRKLLPNFWLKSVKRRPFEQNALRDKLRSLYIEVICFLKAFICIFRFMRASKKWGKLFRYLNEGSRKRLAHQNGELRAWDKNSHRGRHRLHCQEHRHGQNSSWGTIALGHKNKCRTCIFQTQYQIFLKKHPDGRISRKSFHTMMKECYPGADTEKLERHIFRMYDSNKVELRRRKLCRIFRQLNHLKDMVHPPHSSNVWNEFWAPDFRPIKHQIH